MPDTIGRRIAQRRKMLSLSQEALGEKMGISRQAISKWEADASIPELDRLMDMSKLFDVSLDWLISGEDAPQPEDPSPDLTDTITQTLQPPQPQAPPSPEPPPEGPPTPQKHPSHLSWPILACIILTISSLLLSLLCLTRSPQQTQSTTNEAHLQTQIDDLEKEVASLTQALADLDSSYDLVWEGHLAVSALLDTLQQEMDTLSEMKDLSPGLPVALPSYDSLATWSIDGNANADLSAVTICFRCVPVSQTASIRLQVYQNDQLCQTMECTLEDQIYHCQITLPSENGYRYILLLEQPDGSIERLSLDGHGLSDLDDLTKPQLHVTYSGAPIVLSSEGDEFWESYPQIRLQIPTLAPDAPQLVWADLWISHYKNGQFLEEFCLMDERELQDVDLTDHIIRFRVTAPTFHTDGMQEGDCHQILLEGKLEINGTPIPFSFVLETLTLQNGDLISAEK